MRALLVLLVIAGTLFAVYYFHLLRMPSPDSGTAPTQAISLTSVRMKLLQIAQAERGYIVLNGRCASLEELISSNAVLPPITDRDAYTFSVECSGDAFSVKAQHAAVPAGSPIRYPSFVIDATMQIQEVN